jgi:hypothetical protein
MERIQNAHDLAEKPVLQKQKPGNCRFFSCFIPNKIKGKCPYRPSNKKLDFEIQFRHLIQLCSYLNQIGRRSMGH